MNTQPEALRVADEIYKISLTTPTTHVRIGKAEILGQELTALWLDECSDYVQQAIYINATKPEKLKPLMAELIRLHALNQELVEALKLVMPALMALRTQHPRCEHDDSLDVVQIAQDIINKAEGGL